MVQLDMAVAAFGAFFQHHAHLEQGRVHLFLVQRLGKNQIYLIETRCSGALIKPFSAIAVEMEVKTAN